MASQDNPTSASAGGAERKPTPIASRQRALGPDLGRGSMLLLIVVSNTMFYLYAAQHGPTGWHPVDGGRLDQFLQFLMIVGLDLRVYPLFAFLFGYGMVQLYQRQTRAGATHREASVILRRRSLWLIVFGFLHAALLMAGDILGAYGLMSLILGWLFIRRSDRTLLVAAAIFVGLLVVLWGLTLLALAAGESAADEPTSVELYASGDPNPLSAAVTRLSTWSLVTLFGGLLGFGFHAAMLIGYWAARHAVLEHPENYRPLLGWTACIGITIGWVGGLPTALGHLQLVAVPDAWLVESGPLFTLQVLTGVFGGLGYAALLGWIVSRLPESVAQSGPVRFVAAIGKRSLSSYLGFSIVFSPLLAAWGLGLGAHLSTTSMLLVAVGVWLLVGCGCWFLEQRDRRGPAELLLRRLAYR